MNLTFMPRLNSVQSVTGKTSIHVVNFMFFQSEHDARW
jgi:hypothetical protein